MIYILIFLFCIFFAGGSVFSFINVVADRLPNGESIVRGRSHCDKCNKTLNFIEMIPVFSYLFLRGKCSKCKNKLSIKYFLTELAGGFFALYCVYFYWGNLGEMLVAFFFISVLACVFLIDMKTMTIPNSIVIAVLITSIISIFVFDNISIVSRIIGFFNVSVPLLIMAIIINGAFGGGDIKLMAATGVFLGWKLNFLALFIAIVLGGAYGIFLIIKGNRDNKTHFAFGPFLAIGCVFSMFWGELVLNWYLGLFL